MKLNELRGLKYPDDFVIKFFFKNGLHNRKGRVLELGCSNGNNLMMFREYGWEINGVDISAPALADAEFNFQPPPTSPAPCRFIRHDLARGLPRVVRGHFDVILIPNVLNYLMRNEALSLLRAARRHAKPGTRVFVRTRSVRDYRHRRGQSVGGGSFRMTTDETGEKGLINTCYRECELADMVRNQFGVRAASLQVFSVESENLHGGLAVLNSDIVVWGTIR
ncbi:MAG TPA: class I SAM-dependent methyltransferase [Verrucomicrobiae bacterium]|nr:class I SAM-dependent methyltransferase [Verrucomicrobiae bacterium]